ncbi:MAG TPA: lipocalin-like domain-containing protein [Dehalococcoidia bacterium]|nr:lipocalin-like domain-containing protein [Dehalococcoidia bacterium]
MGLRDDIAGAWRLLRWESHAPDGAISLPYGERLVGLLLFTPSGFMSGQIMLPEDGALSSAAAVVAGSMRYIAYCGPFTVDEAAMTITTLVEASVSRSWVGTDQVRRVELSGDTLVLRPPPRPAGDQAVLTWRRLGSPG